MEAADYVVIGGGVYGCGVAWELARRGREVLLLEASGVASGASGGIGMRGVRANGRDPRELPLMRRAYALWPELEDAVGSPTGFARIGHLQLLDGEDPPPAALAQVEAQRHHGIETELLDRGEALDLEPELAASVVAAVWCGRDGVADHGATTTGLRAAAQREGAIVRERTPVEALVREGERVTAVSTVVGDIGVRRLVVVVANSSVAGLVEPLGVELPIFTVFPQVIVTAPLRPVPARHIVAHPRQRLSLKPLPDQTLMMTGEWLGHPDEAGRGVVDPQQVAGSLAAAGNVYPVLRDVSVATAVADRPEAASHDLVPIVDLVPGTTNALLATGWSGHGFAIAPAITELVADWAITGERPGLLRPFALDRFAGPD